MYNISNYVRKYPLTIIFIVVIWTICLIPIPETPMDKISFIDKWTHVALYFVLVSTIGHEHFHNGHHTHYWLWCLAAPTIMGGLIELVQAYCTNGQRSGDWIDFFADAIGCILGYIICILLVRWRATR